MTTEAVELTCSARRERAAHGPPTAGTFVQPRPTYRCNLPIRKRESGTCRVIVEVDVGEYAHCAMAVERHDGFQGHEHDPGYDHIDDADASVMEGRERDLLAAAGRVRP